MPARHRKRQPPGYSELDVIERRGTDRYHRLVQLYRLLRRSRQPRSDHSVRALSQRIGVTDSLVSRWECLDKRASLWLAICWADALGADLVLVPRPRRQQCPAQLSFPFAA